MLSVNPSLTTQQVKNIMLANVDQIPAFANRCTSGGRLNANRAVRGAVALLPQRVVTFNPQGGAWPAVPGFAETPNTLSRSMTPASTNYNQVINRNNRDILVGIGTQGSARLAPTRSGFSFIGWFTAPTGGSRVDHNTTVASGTGTIALHARWGPPVRSIHFNPQGGTWPAASGLIAEASTFTREIRQAAITYAEAMNVNNVDILARITNPNGNPARPAPARTGYTFAGWFTAATGGARVNHNTEVTPGTGAITLHARWIPPVRSVHFDPQGGTWPASGGLNSSTTIFTRDIRQSATNYAEAMNVNNVDILARISNQSGSPARPAPTRSGHAFMGWFTTATGGTRVNHNTTVAPGSGAITLHARWASVRSVHFNPQGGTWPASGGLNSSTTIFTRDIRQASTTYAEAMNANNIDILARITNPTGSPARPAPTRVGYSFAGWFTAPTGGTRVNHNTAVTPGAGEITLHARWTQLIRHVSFNPQGGTWPAVPNFGETSNSLSRSMSQASTNYSQVMNFNNRDILAGIGTQGPERPAPTRAGFSFMGWFTAPTGGTRVNHNTTVATGSGTIELHARWGPPVRSVLFNPQGGTWPATSGLIAETITFTRDIRQAATTYAEAMNVNNLDILARITNPAGSPARPAPTRAGHTFAGWFTAATGGTRVNHNTAVTPGAGTITLHARWT